MSICPAPRLNVTARQSAWSRLPVPAACLLLTALCLSGCASLQPDPIRTDYEKAQSGAALVVPPDLTQIAGEANDGLRLPPTGSVSTAKAGNSQAPAKKPGYQLDFGKDIDVMRDGSLRWLRLSRQPDQLWKKIETFWSGLGYQRPVNDSAAGVIETDWRDPKYETAQSGVRAVISKVLTQMFDTGQRVRYTTRVEKDGDQLLIFISEQRLEEIVDPANNQQFRWVKQPSLPENEAVLLQRLASHLAGLPKTADPDKSTTTARSETEASPGRSQRAEWSNPEKTAFRVSDTFGRAWLRVTQALDRGGFTVEDRDRSKGVFYIRYVDPLADQNKGFFQNLLRSDKDKLQEARFVIRVVNNDPSPALIDVAAVDPKTDQASVGRIANILFSQVK